MSFYIRFIVLLILAFLATVSLCGCSKKQEVRLGTLAPDFSGTDVTGAHVSIGQFRGKVVLLYFWRNSCCADRVRLLEPLFRKWSKDIDIIAVNVGDSPAVVQSYGNSSGLTFAMLADERSEIFDTYQGIGFPTMFIIGRTGLIQAKVLGDIRMEKLDQLIQRQINLQQEIDSSFGMLKGKQPSNK